MYLAVVNEDGDSQLPSLERLQEPADHAHLRSSPNEISHDCHERKCDKEEQVNN